MGRWIPAAFAAGVRFIVAHGASLGNARDLDRGGAGPMVPAFDLFAWLMDSPEFHGRVLGDLPAVTQGARKGGLARLPGRSDWQPRLRNGFDFPRPGVLPPISPEARADHCLPDHDAVVPLREIHGHNALLFDFVLKRSLRWRGARFGRVACETRSFPVEAA